MTGNYSRRSFLSGTAFAAGVIFTGKVNTQSNDKKQETKNKELEVTAVEDLMREHGILRRSLLVYTSVSHKLISGGKDISPEALKKTAMLFRNFGEDYHERKLEEAYIFPAVKKAGGRAAAYTDILQAQHQRGREITEYISKAAAGNKLNQGNPEQLSTVLDSFVLMYRHHAAREDTIVFPAWKSTLTEQQLDELGDKFEEIEHQQFGEDGFEDAERQISSIEEMLGLNDLVKFTAERPPST